MIVYYTIDGLTFCENDQPENISANTYFEFEIQKTQMREPQGESSSVKAQVLGPNQVEQKEELDNYIQKTKEAKWAIPKAMGNLAVSGVSIAVPEVGIAVGVIQAVDDVSKLGSPVESAVKEYSKNEKVKNGVSMGADTYSEIFSICKAYREQQAAYDELLDDMFEDGTTLSSGGKDITLSRGGYRVNTILKEAYFEHEGISFMAGKTAEEDRETFGDYVEKSGDDLTAMNSTIFKGVDEATRLDMLSLVWCGEPYYEGSKLTLQDLNAAQIDACMQTLDDRKEFKDYVDADEGLDAAYKNYVIPYLKTE